MDVHSHTHTHIHTHTHTHTYTQLKDLKIEFQAGKIEQHLGDWKYLTSDIETLQTMSSLPIEVTDELVEARK